MMTESSYPRGVGIFDSVVTNLLFQVLYLTEPIDEPTITALEKFDGKTFVDVSREGLDLGDQEEDKKKVINLCYHT